MFGGRHMKVELATGDPGYETDRRVFPAAVVQRMGGLETFIGLLSDPALEPLFARLGAFALVDATGRVRASTTSYREVAGETVLPAAKPAVADALTPGGRRSVRRDSIGLGTDRRHVRIEVFPVESMAGIVIQDVTAETLALARAHRERQRGEDIIRASTDWIWETDRQGCVTYLSDQIVRSLAMPAPLLLGNRLDEVLHLSEGGSILAAGPVPALQAFRDLAVMARDAKGIAHHFVLSGVPVYDEAGTFKGYRGTGSDVTDKLAAEAQTRRYRAELESTLATLRARNEDLQKAVQDAQAATRAKSEFLAMMSHELRTPLNAIIGFSEVMTLALFGPLNARYLDYVNDILRSGKHLLALINDILDFARIENQTLRLQPETVPVGDIVNDALTLVEMKAAEKGLSLIRPTGHLDARISADPTRALQIVENLLSNALKFTPPGGRIGVEIDPPSEGRVRIVVWDTGSGVPAEKRQQIFEMFEQAHVGAFARGQEGLGLGLSIARALARRMGGDLVLESSNDRGSRFAVILPLA